MDFGTIIVILLGALAASFATRGLNATERRSAMGAFGAHIVASFAQWAIVEFYYGISDVHVYQEEGGQLARLLDADLLHFAPEVAKLALHFNTSLPFEAFGDGSSTGTMSAVAGVISFLTDGSPLTLYVVAACFSWFGMLCWYRVAKAELDEADHRAALLGMLWVPSVVFWSSGFVKEALVLGFFGIIGLSTHRLFRTRYLPALFGVVVGGVGIACLKSYTLFAYILGVAAFVYADRAWRKGAPIRIRPVYLVLVVAFAVGGIAAMGSLFPEYSADHVAETMATAQEAWRVNAASGGAGGSDIEMGGGEARSLSQQLRYAPLALVTALLRPAIFEARSPPVFAAALENTFLAYALLRLLAGSVRATVRETVFRTPFIFGSIVFILIFGTGVALATSNLGSLSRYRMPMMPFYATAVLVLRRRVREGVTVSVSRAGLALRASRRSRSATAAH